MTFGFGEPVDPAYVAFRDGLNGAVGDPGDRSRLRWSPRHEHWFRYSADEWVLDDIGLPDTSPEGALKQTGFWPTTYEVVSLYLPGLWGSVSPRPRRDTRSTTPA
jgi:hypothetical protein